MTGIQTTKESFLTRVDKSGGPDACWPYLYKDGTPYTDYGLLSYLGQPSLRSHVVAFYIANGHWPFPQCNHTCDNPPCCNPKHLYEGTQWENVQDTALRNRADHKVNYTPENYAKKLSMEVAREIRREFVPNTYGLVTRLSRKYGVDRALIYKIVQNKTWRE